MVTVLVSVSLSVIMATVVLYTLILVGIASKAVLSPLWTAFCQHSNVKAVQNAVTRLQVCVLEIKMKAEFERGCGSSEGQKNGLYLFNMSDIQSFRCCLLFSGAK